MRGDAPQLGPALVQDPADRHHEGVVGQEARAVAVGVDLDQGRNGVARSAGGGSDGLGLLRRVHQDGEVAPGRADRQHARELLRRDADGVEDVPHAGRREHLRLPQRGDGGGAAATGKHAPRDVHRLRRLEVRPERDAQRVEARAQPLHVPQEPALLEEEAGGGERVQKEVFHPAACWRRTISPIHSGAKGEVQPGEVG